MRRKSSTAEEIIGRIATRQHGVVTRAQLVEAGLNESAIDRRLRKGSLIALHAGVYRVGHQAPSIEATYLAAVLACGPNALLCGLAAAHLHRRLIKRPPSVPAVLAVVERKVPGVLTQRTRRIDPRDATKRHHIPVTTVPRTIVDLAATLDDTDDLARACHEAGVLHRTTPAHVEAVLARRPNAPGASNLRAILRGETKVTLSKLEARFLQLLRRRELPLPETNRPAGSRRVDARWPEHRLTVELDSYRYHGSRHAWEQDRRREREAHARGDDFRRFTCGDVFERPAPMLRELAKLLL